MPDNNDFMDDPDVKAELKRNVDEAMEAANKEHWAKVNDPWAPDGFSKKLYKDLTEPPAKYGPPGSFKEYPNMDTYEELAEYHMDAEYGIPYDAAKNGWEGKERGDGLDNSKAGYVPGGFEELDETLRGKEGQETTGVRPWHKEPDLPRDSAGPPGVFWHPSTNTAEEMAKMKANPATDTYEELEASYKNLLEARDLRLAGGKTPEAALKEAGEAALNTFKSIPGIGDTVDAANQHQGPTEPLNHSQPSPAELKEMGFDIDKPFVDPSPETIGDVTGYVGEKAAGDAPVVEDAVEDGDIEMDTQPGRRGAGPDAQEPKATPAASGAAANLGGSEGLNHEQEQVAEAAFAPEGAAGPTPTDLGENPLLSVEETGPPTGDVLQTPGAVAADAGDIEMPLELAERGAGADAGDIEIPPEETAGRGVGAGGGGADPWAVGAAPAAPAEDGAPADPWAGGAPSGETVEDVGGEMADPVNPYADSGGFAKEAVDEMPDPVVEEDVVDDIY
jgi:hypothetical protein